MFILSILLFKGDGFVNNKITINNLISGKSASNQIKERKNFMKYKDLTKEEERVIINKGTELPFTGKYWNFDKKGVYLCKNCGIPLFVSSDKFNSHCGWPSFDAALPNAIKDVPDVDGKRVEILCNYCGGHLGHVFYGEGFTSKNVRYCVNSISLDFKPIEYKGEIDLQKAYFAGGCFWGIEYFLAEEKGVVVTRVGYMGGTKKNPTYKEVSKGDTGHYEAVEIFFNNSVIDYKNLAKLFFEIHNPTQLNGQGPDIGPQYRSAIFYVNEEQKKIAEELVNELEIKGYKIATKILRANEFWLAEEYHQQYYMKNNKKPYCHHYEKRF